MTDCKDCAEWRLIADAETANRRQAEAELTRLKELVFGDEVREKVLSACCHNIHMNPTEFASEPYEGCRYCRDHDEGIKDFQKAIKEAVDKPIPQSRSQERRVKAQEEKT